MPTVSPSQSNAGDTIEAADINTPINQLAAVINGGIDATNLASSGVTTAKIADNNITFVKLLTTIFSGQVTTYTNPGSAGGTNSFFYVNLGGIKLFWGATANQTIGGAAPASAAVTITLPVSFFTTIQAAVATPGPITGTQYGSLTTSSISASSWAINFNITVGSAGVFNANVFVVGT